MRMLNEWLHGEARGFGCTVKRDSVSLPTERVGGTRESGLGGSADSIGHVTSSSGEHRATLVTVTVTVTVRTGRLTDCTSVLSY